ncbi:uncharacterized protein [Dysidea avara]|uniref:uncharacterized protein n=1 Tax=Dysidea avara TaxID=196820 RepID=UPI00332CF947
MSNNVDDGVEGSKPLSDETDNRQDQEFPDRTFAKIEAKFLKYKEYNYLIYLSALMIVLCFPLGVAAMIMALQAHEDASKGYRVKAKRKARIVYVIIGAAIVTDIAIIVIVVLVTRT